MKIEFKNTFLDLIRFNASHQFRNIPLQLFYFLCSGFIFYWELCSEKNMGSSVLKALIISLVFYVIMWIGQFLFNIFYLYSRNNKTVLTNHFVEIQDDCFYEETAFNRSYFYWNGISKVIKISGFIAVYITAHTAVLIPKRAFSDSDSREEFYKSIKDKIKTS